MSEPAPRVAHPLPGQPRVGFLAPLVDVPNVEIGAYTYYDDPDGPERFLARCVLHHFDFVGDRLGIGRFCAIATGVRFIMSGANHARGGPSTYPFEIFASDRGEPAALPPPACDPPRDTVVGNDAWIGNGATILPGTHIGDGAIVGAASVVGGSVPPCAIVVGNPARVARHRFPEKTVDRLLALARWDWPAPAIAAAVPAPRTGDLAALEALARDLAPRDGGQP